MLLNEAIGLRPGDMLSLIGAGGKTTTLFRLAKELRAGGKVLVTTTTKIFKPTRPHIDRLFLLETPEVFADTAAKIESPIVIGAGYKIDDAGKLVGLPAAWLDLFEQQRQFDAILVEADGAASRLFKVPSELEPVIPDRSHAVTWTMAVKILGKPLDPEWVHRTERVSALLGVPPGVRITKEHILELVNHPQGCLKGVPSHCRKIALLNQADSSDDLRAATELAHALVPAVFERAVITSYLTEAPVKEVITS